MFMVKNYVSIEDTNPRIFKSDFLEFFTRTHWSVTLYIFIPILLACFYVSIFLFTLVYWKMILLVVAGLVFWTFTEYYLHRFVFHYHPKSERGKRLIFLFHGVHHDYPNDTKRLVMPPLVSLSLAILYFVLFYLVLGDIFVYSFFAGFIGGYLFYDITHYATHHFQIKNKFFLKLKKNHIRHHFQHPDKGFGVSQIFWDRVFGTTHPKNPNQ